MNVDSAQEIPELVSFKKVCVWERELSRSSSNWWHHLTQHSLNDWLVFVPPSSSPFLFLAYQCIFLHIYPSSNHTADTFDFRKQMGVREERLYSWLKPYQVIKLIVIMTIWPFEAILSWSPVILVTIG